MRLARKAPKHPCRRVSLYIPTKKNLQGDHLLVKELGWALAEAVCDEMHTTHWYVASGAELESAVLSRQVFDLEELGYSDQEISERTGISPRRICHIRAARRAWEETGDIEVARRKGQMKTCYLSILLNRGW